MSSVLLVRKMRIQGQLLLLRNIENPEDYKSPKIYSSKKEATKFYENIK